MKELSNRTLLIFGLLAILFMAIAIASDSGSSSESDSAATGAESSCVEPDNTALGELIRALEVSGNEPWMPWAQSSDGATYWLAATLRDKPGLVVVVSAPIGSNGQQVAVNGTAKGFTALPEGNGMPQEATTALDCARNGGA
jgi:hypothetical protein